MVALMGETLCKVATSTLKYICVMIGQKNSQIPTLRKVCHKAVIADTLGIKFCNNNTSQ